MSPTAEAPPFPASLPPTREEVPVLVAFADAAGAPAVMRGTSLEAWILHKLEELDQRQQERNAAEIRTRITDELPAAIGTALDAHDACAHRIAEHLHAVKDAPIPDAGPRTKKAFHLPDPLIAAFDAAARRAGMSLSDAAAQALSAWVAAQPIPGSLDTTAGAR